MKMLQSTSQNARWHSDCHWQPERPVNFLINSMFLEDESIIVEHHNRSFRFHVWKFSDIVCIIQLFYIFETIQQIFQVFKFCRDSNSDSGSPGPLGPGGTRSSSAVGLTSSRAAGTRTRWYGSRNTVIDSEEDQQWCTEPWQCSLSQVSGAGFKKLDRSLSSPAVWVPPQLVWNIIMTPRDRCNSEDAKPNTTPVNTGRAG